MMSVPTVALLMGSASDRDKVKPAEDIFAEMGVEVKVQVISAHRQLEKLCAFVSEYICEGVEVLLAAVGKGG